MFLRAMSNDQKHLFLALAEKAADANGVREESEKELLNAYADEMGIESIVKEKPLDEILSELSNISTPVEVNQMSFEIIGLLMSDGEYDAEEREFITTLSKGLNVPENRINKMFDLVKEYSDLIRSINKTMFDV